MILSADCNCHSLTGAQDYPGAFAAMRLFNGTAHARSVETVGKQVSYTAGSEIIISGMGTDIFHRVPKGGLAGACLLAFTGVLHALLSSCCCPPRCVIVCWCPWALLSVLGSNATFVKALAYHWYDGKRTWLYQSFGISERYLACFRFTEVALEPVLLSLSAHP